MEKRDLLDIIIRKILSEYENASRKYGAINSTYEGYAVIKKEIDELWDLIKVDGSILDMMDEAIQIASMSIRFIYDINYKGGGNGNMATKM